MIDQQKKKKCVEGYYGDKTPEQFFAEFKHSQHVFISKPILRFSNIELNLKTAELTLKFQFLQIPFTAYPLF